MNFRLVVHKDPLTIVRLPPTSLIPSAIFTLKWYTISKTLDELSIVIPSLAVSKVLIGCNEMKKEEGWRCLQVHQTIHKKEQSFLLHGTFIFVD